MIIELIESTEHVKQYIDPGTGSLIWQMAMALILGGGVYVGIYRKKVVDYIKKLRERKKRDQ